MAATKPRWDFPPGYYTQTELYRYFDADGRLLYVGISVSAINRLAQHRAGSHWYPKAVTVTIERFPNRYAALQAERNAIRTESPIHNIAETWGLSQERGAVQKVLPLRVNRTRRLTEEVYYGEQCGRFYDQKHVSFIRRPGERAYWRFRVIKKAMKIETMRAVGKSLEDDRLLFRRWNRLVDEGINPLEVD